MSAAIRFSGLVLTALLLAVTAHGQETPHGVEHQHHHAAPVAKPHEPVSVPTESEREHVPPKAPTQEMHDIPYKQMTQMMEMDDTNPLSKVVLDQLDWRDADGTDTFAWDAQAWYGNDYDKLWLKIEGERGNGKTEEARTEALWDRIFSRWWSVQGGARYDFGEGPSRGWGALGVQGLAPYFFEIEATAYIGDSGRTAARFSAGYDLLITQRLILQPELEMNLYGKDDPAKVIGAGLSDMQFALRLRYEIRRELAPYVGLVWTRYFGNTADLAQAAGEDKNEIELLAGLRVWF